MNHFSKTTAIALVLGLAGLSGAQAATLNTIPLNYLGKPVSSTPVTTTTWLALSAPKPVVTTAAGLLPNTTISSSLNASHNVVTTAAGLLPNTTISSSLNTSHNVVTTAAGLLPNTTISSSLNASHNVVTTAAGLLPNTTSWISVSPPKAVVTTAAGLLPNTTISSSLNASHAVVTTAAGLLAGGATFAVPNVQATIATGPISVPKPGSTTPDYGPYADASSTPDSLSSLTDVQTAVSQSNGLTNLQMFGAQQAQSTAGSLFGGAINKAPSVAAPSIFASNVQSAIKGAAGAITANFTAAQSSAGAIAGAVVNGTPASQNGLTAGGAQSAIGAAASVLNQSSWTAAAATSDAGANGGLGKAPPIVIKLPTSTTPTASGAINIGSAQTAANNAFSLANPFGSNNPNPSAAGSQLNGSVPAIFNPGLPTQGSPPLTAGDINTAQNILGAWGYLGLAAIGGGGISSIGKIGSNASIVNPITSTAETEFGTGLGNGAAGAAGGGSGAAPGINPLSNMIKALLGKY